MPISFRELNRAEQVCLDRLYMDEPFNNLPGVGMPTIRKLIAWGLIEESPETPYGADVHYRRTSEGTRVWEGMHGAGRLPR